MKTAAARAVERAVPEERRNAGGFEWPHRGAEPIEYRQTQALERDLRDALAGRRRAEAALHEVVQTLSREMRTPLAAILGWLRVVNEEPLDPASTRRALEVIERNARVQLNLIDDLLDGATPGATSIPPR